MYQQPYTFVVPSSEESVHVIKFPHEFISTPGIKFVQLLKVNCVVNLETDAYGNDTVYPLYSTPENISVHSTINQNLSQNDRFICFTNEVLPLPKLFQQFTPQREFRIWFKDNDGNLLPTTNAKITIQCNLIW